MLMDVWPLSINNSSPGTLELHRPLYLLYCIKRNPKDNLTRLQYTGKWSQVLTVNHTYVLHIALCLWALWFIFIMSRFLGQRMFCFYRDDASRQENYQQQSNNHFYMNIIYDNNQIKCCHVWEFPVCILHTIRFTSQQTQWWDILWYQSPVTVSASTLLKRCLHRMKLLLLLICSIGHFHHFLWLSFMKKLL